MDTSDPGLANELQSIKDIDGEPDPRVEALLLLSRMVYGQDDIESYAGILPEPLNITEPVQARVDGVLNNFVGDELQHVLLVWIGAKSRGKAITQAISLSEALENPHTVEQALSRQRTTKSIVAEMRPMRRDADTTEWRVALISEKPWSKAERTKLEAIGSGRLDWWDRSSLSELTAARQDPTWLTASTEIQVFEPERLETRAGGRRIFVAPVAGTQIADWPGIDNRRLFDLNVRFGLGSGTRVRRSLDMALVSDRQGDFLASHNGLTVVCERVDATENGLRVSNFSVVNGAQSVIALRENRATLDPEVRLLVKFVELGPDDELATEIAIRSNTQNPVTGRNLRALDESQLRLRKELSARGYVFETRPDAKRRTGEREIKNDLAAQWICAVYLERPWLAVKRTVLFQSDIFHEIYSPKISAEHVILLFRLRSAIDQVKPEFPIELQRTWLLTALTAMYLAGQVMRSSADDRGLLLSPPEGEGDSEQTGERIADLVDHVKRYMASRHQRVIEEDGYDNFRVEFKRQRTLLEMSSEIVRAVRVGQRDGVK